MLDRFARFLCVLGAGVAGKGVTDQNRRDAPVGDRAARIAFQYLAKCFFTLLKPERVQHRHRAIELRLYFLIT